MSKDVKHEEDMGNPTDFDPMDDEQVMNFVDQEIWLDREQENLLDVNEASIFYSDFPPLPDFPCMSSSSSSSSLPAPTKLISTTSSCSSVSSASAASWSVLKTDATEEATEKEAHHYHHHHQVDVLPPGALSSTASMEVPVSEGVRGGTGDFDCMNVMENFGYMDLIDNNDIWDPSSVFQSENPQDNYQEEQKMASMEGLQQDQKQQCDEDDNNGLYFLQGNSELSLIFFEWLKQNKDHISAEDMRSIKLKRSTIESALKRLGSTEEGKKQLLKLILEWVEQYQLQRKRMRETSSFENPFPFLDPAENPNSNPNPIPNINLHSNSIPPPDLNACFCPSPWMAPPPPYVSESSTIMAPPGVFNPGMGYIGDPFSNGAIYPSLNQPVNGNPYLPTPEFEAIDSVQSWQQSQLAMPSQSVPFPDNGSLSSAAPPPPAMYGSQYPYQVFDGNGRRLVRLGSSATKEARKKRMARQRRLSTHHFRHQNSTNQNQNQMNDHQHTNINGGSCTSSPASPSSWVYWPPTTAPPASAMAMVPPVDTSRPIPMERPPMQSQNYHRQVPSDRRQGWKTEKNLKFLLQKVLKQSDVGNLGRIVLPKKEAEIHLPELDSRDGISIAMEDIGTSRVWNMRYRFWPNNKSRMYLLENTGEFVRANGLQEGDFIVLYSDTKCGKYLIRGVKVRQPGPKLEGKKPARRNHRNIAPALNGSSHSSPIKRQAVK